MDEEHWNNDQNSNGLKKNVPWRYLIKPKEYVKSLLVTDRIMQGHRR